MPAPITSTATRSGSRIIVARDERVLSGHEALISIFSDSCDVLTFTPRTAVALAHMILRAAVTEIRLTIRVSNNYSDGEAFVRDYSVTVDAPADDAILDDWAVEHLLTFTGEGPEYAGVEALYEVEILAAPTGFDHLVGLRTSAMG